ncbi:Mitochondrial import receptor subunit TOM22 [Kluyveromyces marxianus]|uniref:Mitochondrial import receptor subunit TOM22 n=2 Tax=Kluyveromyces marxianus TaxID=4911 RepID=W0TDW3_KLUMD|nr:mitochondrial import receptor subunit TOM22 [Kluyveromyces marxianus DMKU3-1042]QGN17300.1 mitochondrial import receptor subunit TOM22 [Kluyveromyces marxianus]BAO41555.1 mitochondrial import receptor subunit TOM22 [Kluyveromyces marxianus DMKU3-1042]BAP72995.1 mitochondrial import receptor subunit TOM22 [Kluyveromyces marxianus]
MVELTELTEETPIHQTAGETAADPAVDTLQHLDESDEEEDYSSDDEDFYEDETIYERLVALKDIIPPQKRKTISGFYNGTVSTFRSLFSKGGNLLWAVTTSALLLGVPLSLSILAEQQLIEMEKSFDLQKDANDILTAGEGTAAPVTPAVAA